MSELQIECNKHNFFNKEFRTFMCTNRLAYVKMFFIADMIPPT